MKIITNETKYEIDIFDVMHLFMQNQKLDEEKPFVYFDMQQNGRDLYFNFKIDFDNKVETYNPDGTVKLPIPNYSINSTWGQNGKFYEIDNLFPEGFSCIWGKQIIDEPVCYASGSWKITYPNTGTRMGFQSPLFEEDLKLEIWFSVSEIHGNTDKLDEDNPWIRIYGYSSEGKLIRTKDIESPNKFTERRYNYAFNGEGVNYFEIRFLSQPHEGTKCYNFGISEIGVKSFPYAYND